MKHLILTVALALGVSGSAFASELDNEAGVTNQQLNGTIVIRVDSRTQAVSALKTDAELNSLADAQALALQGHYADANVRTELDSDGGASSWYYYPGYGYGYGYNYGYGYGYGYGYNNLNWYGSWYRPCYSYAYGNYNYYYYSNRNWNWAY